MGNPPGVPAPIGHEWRQGPTSSLRRVGTFDGAVQRNVFNHRRMAVWSHRFVIYHGKLLPGSLGLALAIPHAGIETALRQEGVVGPALDNDPLVENNDLVGAHNGRKTVRYHECRSVS